MALDIKKREFQRQKLAEQKAQKEAEELRAIEAERQRLFKERRLREAATKATAETEGEPNPKKSNPLKVRSLAKFMQDQNKYEIKRHEKLKKIMLDEWTNGEYTYNPTLSVRTIKILEDLEAKKERGSDSEGEKKPARKAYVPEELTFSPNINKRSKDLKRGKDVTTVLVNDAGFRSARKEQA